MESFLLFVALLQLSILTLKFNLKRTHFILKLTDPLSIFIIFMFQPRILTLNFLLILLQRPNGLLIFHTDTPFAFNLSLQLMDGLLEINFVVEQLLNFPHAVADN
jgi:hypothetical protein